MRRETHTTNSIRNGVPRGRASLHAAHDDDIYRRFIIIIFHNRIIGGGARSACPSKLHSAREARERSHAVWSVSLNKRWPHARRTIITCIKRANTRDSENLGIIQFPPRFFTFKLSCIEICGERKKNASEGKTGVSRCRGRRRSATMNE